MNSCYCDYDSPEFYHKEVRLARKSHECDECGGRIVPGEKYEHVRGKWNDINTFKTCSRCLTLREFVLAHIPCSCWQHGNMIEDVMADAEAFSHEAPGLLFGSYRRRVAIERAIRKAH